jgi:hypothetical protein
MLDMPLIRCADALKQDVRPNPTPPAGSYEEAKWTLPQD